MGFQALFKVVWFVLSQMFFRKLGKTNQKVLRCIELDCNIIYTIWKVKPLVISCSLWN